MFKITWDKKNNGVLLTMRSTEETLNVSPRPVFYEELDMLGLDKFWTYPKSTEPLLWACDRRYFYKGELVLEAKGGNIYDDPQLIFTEEGKKRRGIIKEQCHKIDEEFKEYMPEIRLK